jgi:hypothetical protein
VTRTPRLAAVDSAIQLAHNKTTFLVYRGGVRNTGSSSSIGANELKAGEPNPVPLLKAQCGDAVARRIGQMAIGQMAPPLRSLSAPARVSRHVPAATAAAFRALTGRAGV